MKKERLIYLDILKIIAMIMVIHIHIVSPMWWHNNIYSVSFAWANFFEGISRWAVPIFVMSTGALLLNPEVSLPANKLLKKIIRMVITLLVFGTLYSIGFRLINNEIFNLTLIINALKDIYLVKAANHLWFIYMLIGLYLIAPILKTYIKNASKKNIEYFLILWATFSLIIPMIINLGLKSAIPLVNELRLTMVLYYPGYLVLGHYLNHYTVKENHRIIAYVLGVIGLYITIFMTYDHITNIGRTSQLYFGYNTLNVALTAIGLFLFSKYNLNKIKTGKKIITLLSTYTFSIFLVHGFLVYMIPRLYDLSFLYEHLYLTPIIALIVYLISFIIVYILAKIPYLKKLLI